ncbi:hypothetical protein [Hydrogenovibrio marinus]|uniref:Uncharacterized protein n=1 Tax=Hydrogenovibrio marinus TaxID=28885 RepID=A0A066ZME6_HYDMR|nr:hypothetical protein [Hydrogenovibrio marinus]KDN94662.1 hypothetical protein EI16_12240 [Hydrogenovibrio marinus]
MIPSEVLINVLQEGNKVRLHGIDGYTRKEAANLIGIKQLTQLDVDVSKYTNLACWMLENTTKTNILNQKEFSSSLLGTNFQPGEYEQEQVTDALAKTRIGKQTAEYVLDVLANGKSLNDLPIPKHKHENVRQACQNIVADLNNGSNRQKFVLEGFKKTLSKKLQYFSPAFFLQVITYSSRNRIEKLFNGEGKLSTPEIAMVQIATLMNDKKLLAFEAAVYEILKTIEDFRYERYVQIRKLSVLLTDTGDCDNFPLWLRFFDQDSRSQFPELELLSEVYENILKLNKLSADAIREAYREKCGANKRISIFDFAKAKKILDEKKFNMSEVHRKVQPKTDVANFHRSYKTWQQKWKKHEYWKD